jgi:superfamily II DNA or RNA helicase
MNCKIHVLNEVWSVIHGLKSEHVNVLWKEFGPEVEGARFMPLVVMGRWDGHIRFFEKTGKTYTKILPRIIPFLELWDYDIELEDDRIAFPNPEKINATPFPNKEIELRPYQVQSVNLGIENCGGFLIAGTGAGKSLMTSGLSHAYSQIGYNAITIVPSSDLVTQTAEWYQIAGLDTGIYSGDNKDYHHQNVVATWQSVQNNVSILEGFDCLIWDEAHGCSANVAQKIINEAAAHMPFKFGVTGTFPKHIANQLSLHSAIGDILIEIPTAWLIENSYLAEVEIEKILIKQKNKEEFPDYSAERAYLSRNEERMDIIADIIIDKCQTYGNTLVLVNSVPFGEKLTSLIEDAVFLYGGSKKEERKFHYDLFDKENGLIRIATAGIASTGVSIDRVFCLIFVDAGKSFIKTIQSCGRGTRLAHDKNKVHIVDIFADLKWSKKHSRERDKWYTEVGYPIISKINYKI